METELCDKCNQPKQIYYGLFCPRCDKPQLETKTFYNLFRCMYHIEAIGHPCYKERLWKYLVDDVLGNDSFLTICCSPEYHGENPDVKLLFDTFNIKDEEMLFYVSW